jgi:hypothetical protein
VYNFVRRNMPHGWDHHWRIGYSKKGLPEL